MSKPNPIPARLMLIIGSCGAGKSTISSSLSSILHTPTRTLDADMFHSEQNISKMEHNIPLTDEDRYPWLQKVGEAMRDTPGTVVMACSALKRIYRDMIRTVVGERVVVVFLKASEQVLRERMEKRQGHFMGSGMVQSQLMVLEEPTEEEGDVVIVEVDEKNVADVTDEVVKGLRGLGFDVD